MIEYFLIFILYGLGAYFSALEKVGNIRKRNPSSTFKEIGNTYLSEEWNTIMVSFGGLVTLEIGWFIMHKESLKLPEWLHGWGVYIISLTLGYCFQRIIYKFLGTTEKAIENRIDNKGDKP